MITFTFASLFDFVCSDNVYYIMTEYRSPLVQFQFLTH